MPADYERGHTAVFDSSVSAKSAHWELSQDRNIDHPVTHMCAVWELKQLYAQKKQNKNL